MNGLNRILKEAKKEFKKYCKQDDINLIDFLDHWDRRIIAQYWEDIITQAITECFNEIIPEERDMGNDQVFCKSCGCCFYEGCQCEGYNEAIKQIKSNLKHYLNS